jgi:HNH endonuclease
MSRATPEARFRSKYRIDEAGCWEWTAAIDQDGYGRFWVDGQVRGAHQVAYMWWGKDSFDPVLAVDHLCRVRHCVNPDHLEQVTHKENLIRRPEWAPVKSMPGGLDGTEALLRKRVS